MVLFKYNKSISDQKPKKDHNFSCYENKVCGIVYDSPQTNIVEIMDFFFPFLVRNELSLVYIYSYLLLTCCSFYLNNGKLWFFYGFRSRLWLATNKYGSYQGLLLTSILTKKGKKDHNFNYICLL